MNPSSAVTATKKSRVVIAADTASVTSSGSPVAAKIQDLVDNAIMALSGKTDKGAAYEALFPAKVTSSTKIYMKRNGASGTGAVNTAVTAAFQKGLQNMLGGSFPAANIDNPTKVPGNVSVKSHIDAADYIINCPVAWMHSVAYYGVTLSQKNTMNYDGDPYSHHNENPPTWLYKVSLSDAIKPKQVLSLMDAVVGSASDGPTTSPKFKAGTIIVGSDIVAVDYNTLRLLEKQPNVLTKQIATGDKNLKSAEAAGLGTCTESNMEVIKITAPWNATGIFGDSEALLKSMNIRVANDRNRVEFVVPGASSKSMSVAIFDMKGAVVWQSGDRAENMIVWNKIGMYGDRVPPAMYIYRIACGVNVVRGTVWVM
jgi:hypothetical protein